LRCLAASSTVTATPFRCVRVSPDRDLHYYRLTRHHCARIVPLGLAVFIHEPGHRLRISVDVRRECRGTTTISLMSGRMFWKASQFVFGQELRLTVTPPFAPPNGMPATAHFHVIHIDNALPLRGNVGMVSNSAFVRSRALLCWLLNPW